MAENDVLEDYSKILLATSSINYMAYQISSLNKDLARVPDKSSFLKEGVEHKAAVLRMALSGLAQIMEDLGECLNASDVVMPIDEKVLMPAFDIVVHDMDNVNGE